MVTLGLFKIYNIFISIMYFLLKKIISISVFIISQDPPACKPERFMCALHVIWNRKIQFFLSIYHSKLSESTLFTQLFSVRD